ncbi:MAG: YitT family protein, partial [Selenomonas sp.]|nr:YitT family protein [Selenomonas sp.]
MTKNELRKQTVRYIQITLGALIVCLGFNLFIIPAHLLTGGISGIALIIYYLTDLPVGMQNIVYNLPILYLAYKVFGRLYAWDTVVGTVVLSLILDATHFLVDWNITQDGMLNA